jgi:hypothetical protein
MNRRAADLAKVVAPLDPYCDFRCPHDRIIDLPYGILFALETRHEEAILTDDLLIFFCALYSRRFPSDDEHHNFSRSLRREYSSLREPSCAEILCIKPT